MAKAKRSGVERVDPNPVTVPRFVEAKRQGRKLTMLTAYDYLWAGIFDAAGVDSILVGDTLGMVVQGKPTTLPVTARRSTRSSTTRRSWSAP